MSLNDPTITLIGFLGADPRHFPGDDDRPAFTTFRVASTRRRLDRISGLWSDGRTTWYTVKVWRSAARNAAESLRKGDRVLVYGRLTSEEWEGADGPRTGLVVEAVALGHDLSQGTSRFARTIEHGHKSESEAAAGAAASESEHLSGDDSEADPWELTTDDGVEDTHGSDEPDDVAGGAADEVGDDDAVPGGLAVAV